MVIDNFFYFILLHIAVVFSQNHLSDFFFSFVYSCLIYCRFVGHECMGTLLGFLLVPLIYVSVFVLVPYCFYYCCFVVESEVRECDSSRCCFSRLFWLFRIFCDSKKILKFRYVFSLLFAVAHPLQPHGLQHPRLPCPSLSPGVCSNSCPLS